MIAKNYSCIRETLRDRIAELESLLRLAGFGPAAYFGAYDPAVPAGATDRLVAVAQLSGVAANRGCS